MSRRSLTVIVLATALAACGGSGAGGAATGTVASTATVPAAADAPARVAVMEAGEEPLPPFPSSPQPAPDALLGTITIPSVAAMVTAASALAENAQPGAGAQINDDFFAGLARQLGYDISGIDLAQPIRVLLLDPEEFAQPGVAVVGVADEAALEHLVAALGMRVRIRGGLAAFGARDALIAAGGYALTTLLTEPTPVKPTAEVHVAKVMARYEAALDRLVLGNAPAFGSLAQDPFALLVTALESAVALARQVDRLEVALELDAERASLVARVWSLPDADLATFIGAQAPGTFDLLAQLPAGSMSLGGRLDLRAVMKAVTQVLEPLLTGTPPGATQLTLSAFKRWFDLATGENAAVVDLPPTGATLAASWEIREPAEVEALWRDYLTALAAAAGTATESQLEAQTGTQKHRGAKLSTFTAMPAATADADTRAAFLGFFGATGLRAGTGVVDQRLLVTAGPDAVARVKALIDLHKARKAKSSAAAATALTAALAEARRRGESYVVAYDATALEDQLEVLKGGQPASRPAAPAGGREPVVIAIGTAEGALTLRLTVPAAQLETFTQTPLRP